MRGQFDFRGLQAFSKAFVAIPPFTPLALIFSLLYSIRLQVARQFDHDILRLAVCSDELVDHASDLVQADVHGWVADPPVPCSFAVLLGVFAWVSAHYVSFERLPVVGQLLVGLLVAEIRMVRVSGIRNRVRVEAPVFHVRKKLGDGLFAQVEVAAGECDVRYGLGLCVVKFPLVLGLARDIVGILRFEQESHDIVAGIERKRKPAVAEQLLPSLSFLLHETNGRLVSFDRLASTSG